jgi:hypothetical protein
VGHIALVAFQQLYAAQSIFVWRTTTAIGEHYVSTLRLHYAGADGVAFAAMWLAANDLPCYLRRNFDTIGNLTGIVFAAVIDDYNFACQAVTLEEFCR